MRRKSSCGKDKILSFLRGGLKRYFKRAPGQSAPPRFYEAGATPPISFFTAGFRARFGAACRFWLSQIL